MSKYNGKTPNCKCVVCKKGLYEPPSVLKRRKKFFCSKECKAAYGSKLKIYECENCKKEFPRYPSETKKSKRHFCSKECNYDYKGRVGYAFNDKRDNQTKYRELSRKVGKDLEEWLREMYWDNQKSTTEISSLIFGTKKRHRVVSGWMSQLNIPLRSISEAMSGTLNSMYGIRGRKNPNYNHDIPDKERITRRNYREYNEFRESVYKRDNYTCQVCLDDTGGNLVCHHLNGYHWDKGGRTEPDNGVTLCETCHDKFHSIYGKTDNNLFQFSQFKESYQLIK